MWHVPAGNQSHCNIEIRTQSRVWQPRVARLIQIGHQHNGSVVATGNTDQADTSGLHQAVCGIRGRGPQGAVHSAQDDLVIRDQLRSGGHHRKREGGFACSRTPPDENGTIADADNRSMDLARFGRHNAVARRFAPRGARRVPLDEIRT